MRRLGRRLAGIAVLAGALALLGCGQTFGRSTRRHARPSLGVLFVGTRKSAWGHDQSATPGRVRNVVDPAGGGATVLRFTTLDSDVYPLTPTMNPRSQLITRSGIVTVNQPFWESFEVFLPRSFPVARTYNGWLTFGSPFYGPPYAGTPSVELSVADGRYRWQADGYGPQPYRIFWQSRLTLQKWTQFTWHVNPAVNGFAELYVNGRPVSVSTDGHKRFGVSLPVIDPDEDQGPWASQLNVYYKLNAFPRLTVYFKDFRIATTHAGVMS